MYFHCYSSFPKLNLGQYEGNNNSCLQDKTELYVFPYEIYLVIEQFLLPGIEKKKHKRLRTFLCKLLKMSSSMEMMTNILN